MLQDFAAEIGQPACNLSVAAAEYRAAARSGQHVPAWTELMRKLQAVRECLKQWQVLGFGLGDLIDPEECPFYHRVLEAAEALVRVHDDPHAGKEDQRAAVERLLEAVELA
jgi:hypothetical protein